MNLETIMEDLYLMCKEGDKHDIYDAVLEIFYAEENPIRILSDLGMEIDGKAKEGSAGEKVPGNQIKRIDCFFRYADVSRLNEDAIAASCIYATMFKARLEHYDGFCERVSEVAVGSRWLQLLLPAPLKTYGS